MIILRVAEGDFNFFRPFFLFLSNFSSQLWIFLHLSVLHKNYVAITLPFTMLMIYHFWFLIFELRNSWIGREFEFPYFPAAHKFGYDDENGPNTWRGLCQTGKRQSPVDIKAFEIEIAYLDPLQFINYELTGHIHLANNGHTGELSINLPEYFFKLWNFVFPFIIRNVQHNSKDFQIVIHNLRNVKSLMASIS